MKRHRILRPSAVCLLSVFCILLFAFCLMPQARAQKVIDQILVLVNDGLITKTDLMWSLALDPNAPSPVGPVGSDLLRRKLDVMIDYRLIHQEATRIPSADITQEEIDKERNNLIAQFKSEAIFRERVESVGLTPERIDELMREKITINRFVDFRFRSFVFVSEQEIKDYYENRIVPEYRSRGQVPPPLAEGDIRQGIINNLRESKTFEELDRWLRETRQRADIVILAEP